MVVFRVILMAVGVLCMMTTFLFLKHEKYLEKGSVHDLSDIKTIRNIISFEEDVLLKEMKSLQEILVKEAEQEAEIIAGVLHSDAGAHERAAAIAGIGVEIKPRVEISHLASSERDTRSGESSHSPPIKPAADEPEKTGLLKCNGKYVNSEVIYWKIVPGDNTYESPITPHHGLHHDRYLSYEYDEGGWNNIRMG